MVPDVISHDRPLNMYFGMGAAGRFNAAAVRFIPFAGIAR